MDMSAEPDLLLSRNIRFIYESLPWEKEFCIFFTKRNLASSSLILCLGTDNLHWANHGQGSSNLKHNSATNSSPCSISSTRRKHQNSFSWELNYFHTSSCSCERKNHSEISWLLWWCWIQVASSPPSQTIVATAAAFKVVKQPFGKFVMGVCTMPCHQSSTVGTRARWQHSATGSGPTSCPFCRQSSVGTRHGPAAAGLALGCKRL